MSVIISTAIPMTERSHQGYGPRPWRQDCCNYQHLQLLAVLLLVRCFLSLGHLCLFGKIGIIVVLHRIYSRSQQIFSTKGQSMSIFGLGVHMALGSLLRLSPAAVSWWKIQAFENLLFVIENSQKSPQ